MFTTQERFDAAVIQQMREVIAAAEGQEVLFVGRVNPERRIVSVEVFARGSETSVAAPAEFCERGDIVLHNHPGGVLRPSDADVAVAAGLAEHGIGSAIVNNTVSEVYVLVEPVPPEEIAPIDEEALAGHIAAGGAVSAGLPHFRERPSQVEMLRSVVQGFNEDRIVVA
ncbi:MAG: hypothetical protein PF508_10865, partial [Spirochaeta sp.]|nr:hypothetical protein [Spirochaeta sp.]